MRFDAFADAHEASTRLFRAVRREVTALGAVDIRVTKSQVVFQRRGGAPFARLPNMYMRRGGVPLLLTVELGRRDDSPRWAGVVEARRGRFTHHIELYAEADVDDEVRGWLREAWDQAAGAG